MFDGKSILVTGGTGSFGRRFCQQVLRLFRPARLIVYSRDEFKQSEMAADPAFASPSMRYFLGDVRDKDRLERAMAGVDFVVHAAALKQVPAAEYNPHEFIKTNINGATNVVEAALSQGVRKVIALSTDKAVNPINLYGATKLCSDKVFIAANSYRGKSPTGFSVVRYGNVIGSRGSVVPRFLKERESGVITVTDPEMTRFFITLDQGVKFVLDSFNRMSGGELFVPRLASCKLDDLIRVLAPRCERRVIGLRPGEKMHEMLIPADEAHLTIEYPDYFLIQPVLPFWRSESSRGGVPCPPNFCYASNTNPQWLTPEELTDYCRKIAIDLGLSADF